MLTPQKIQDLSDPIESVYIAMTNELLVNIGRHITSPTWTHTAAWEIQKLSELGQLTQENAAIINRWIKSLPQEIRDTMEETRRLALEDIEKQMERAAKAGYLTPPERDSTINVLQEYSQQAADQLNLVNTTMLRSSLDQYARMVQLTAEIERQAEKTQEILNEAVGSVAIGTETRTQALNRAIRRISEEGLAGFYDKAGRSWSPEAYVNMDIRTTVHNVAIQSVKNRMEDYNTQVFQVSAHAGARPLCYPFQGKLYSWNNTAGEIETGNGRRMRYEPLNSTSYGEPAGLFGINCGHFPIPVIPGVTIPHAQDFVQPKEENDRQYAESQQQRALERKIRAAKRALEMGDSSPDAKERVKAAQEEMRQFIKATGRTRRPDRESLYGGKKAPTPPRDQRPETESESNKQLTSLTASDRLVAEVTEMDEKARSIYSKTTGQEYAVSLDGNAKLREGKRETLPDGKYGNYIKEDTGVFTAPDNNTDDVIAYGMPKGAKTFLAIDETQNTILTDGRLALNYRSANNDTRKNVSDIINNEIYLLAGVRREGVFYRVMNTEKGVEHLKSGKIRPSVNHMTGESEGGLSVWEIPKYGGGKVAVVTGEVISIGSDGEPVLDVSTVKFKALYKNDKEMREKGIRAFAEKYHWTEEQVRNALDGKIKIIR